MQHQVPISPELIQLWDQAMSLGEDEGKKVYQDFLNKWQEYQKNPPRFQQQQPTEWQKKLLHKQQEVMNIARKDGITIPHEIINLWEQAMSAGEKDGQKSYNEFLKKWDDLESSHKKSEPLAGQFVDNRNAQNNPQRNNQRGTNNERQWHVDPNWRPGPPIQPPNNQGQNNNPYNPNPYIPYTPNQNPYYNPNQNPYYNPNQNLYYGQNQNPYYNSNQNPYYPSQGGYPDQSYYGQRQYPNQRQNPYQGYRHYQGQGQYQNQRPYPNQGPNQYQRPYQGGFNRAEPFAGQQLNEWQTALQDAQKEVMGWAELNGIQVPMELVMNWENAMQQGTQEAYEDFMQMWEQLKEDPSRIQNYTIPGPADIKGKEWQVAIINQIEGQNIIAIMLGLNLINEINDLRNQVLKLEADSLMNIIHAIMDTWNKINIEINRRSKEAPAK